MVSTIKAESSESSPATGFEAAIHSETVKAAAPGKRGNTLSPGSDRETELLSSLLLICGKKPSTASAAEWIAGIISEIDKRISAQINQILHHEAFQTLEGTWRGLHYLVSQ